jgi:hypothetical protein
MMAGSKDGWWDTGVVGDMVDGVQESINDSTEQQQQQQRDVRYGL